MKVWWIYFAFFLFYGLTQSGTVGLEDSGGFLLTGCSFGLSHPPGYALWNGLLKTVGLFFPFLSCAVRVSWIQALLGTGGLLFFWKISETILSEQRLTFPSSWEGKLRKGLPIVITILVGRNRGKRFDFISLNDEMKE